MPGQEALVAALTEIEPDFDPVHMVVDRRSRRATVFLSKEYINHVIEFPAEDGKEAATMILNSARELVKLLVEGLPTYDKEFLGELFDQEWGDVASINPHHQRKEVAVLIFRTVTFSNEEAKKLQTWDLDRGKLRLSWWKISPEGALTSMTTQKRTRNQKSKSPNPRQNKGEATEKEFTFYDALQESIRKNQLQKERNAAKQQYANQAKEKHHTTPNPTGTNKRPRPSFGSPSQSPEKKKPGYDEEASEEIETPGESEEQVSADHTMDEF